MQKMNIFVKNIGKVKGDLFKIRNEFEISLKDLITYNKQWSEIILILKIR